ncbi:MAG: hypothetical protein LUO95_12420 [Methylococcaceae bacterium]|nr:hypothetical protein [Methylococcaceae bacterium]
MDKQGRLLLSKKYREFARMDKVVCW